MLVLTRRTHEDIYIGDGIRIVIVEIDRGKVKIGIECDRNIPVWRGELRRNPNGKDVPNGDIPQHLDGRDRASE